MAGTSDYQKFGILKLTHDNYFTWKEKAKFLLAREGLWTLVRDPPPATPDQKWQDRNEVALSTIGLLLADRHLSDIRNITSAHVAWNTLRTLHESNSIGSRLIIYKRLFTAKYNMKQNIQDYILGIIENASRLEDSGHPIDQEVLGAIMLSGLPREFDPLVTSLEGRSESSITLGYLRDKITEECNRMNRRETDPRPSAKVLLTPHKSPTTDHSQGLTCFYCHKVGHVRKDCRLLSKHKAHQGLNQAQKYPPARRDNAAPRTEYGKATFRSSSNRVEQQMFGESENEEELRPTNSTRERALATMRGDETANTTTWMIDSGSFAHMCNDHTLLENYQLLTDKITITPAGGPEERAEGSGQYVIYGVDDAQKRYKIELKEVLYVPALSDNLLSVTQLNNDGIKVKFGQGKAWAFSEGHKWLLGTMSDRLYKHTQKRPPESHKVMYCLHEWHSVLGHRNYEDIKELSSEGHTVDLKIARCQCSDLCRVCELSKKPRKKFSTVEAKVIKRPFQMLHSDLCGPIHPTSLGGNRYILTLIDDYTNFSNTYMLTHKSEATDKIKEYIEKGINIFGYRPWYLRSDNGGEYCNQDLEKYLHEMGIEHQTTIPYTPQQNGVSERYNRTLLNCVRSLLNQGKFPKKLWGELTSTATYLINLIKPRNKASTPYEMWYGRKPSYDHLKNIGTTCYFTNNLPHKRKLDNRGLEGKLVGYGPSKTFYRIWSPGTNHVHLSRSVTFTQLTECRSLGEVCDEPQEIKSELGNINHTLNQEEPNEAGISGSRRSTRDNKGQPSLKLTYGIEGKQEQSMPHWYQKHNLTDHS